MIRNIFYSVVYEPLYNGLIFLINVLPVFDLGVVIVIFTVIVKLLLFPLSYKAVKAQIQMKALQPEIDEIKEKYKDDKQKQALETMELYKNKQINPFAGIFVLFIQLPIIFALYYIFLRAGFPVVNTEILYSFIRIPEAINVNFLGLIDVTGKSIVLALLAGISQFFQVNLAMPPSKPKIADGGKENSFKDDLARSMRFQMKYILPIFVVFIAYTISAGVALYWVTSNLFAIGQELVVRKKLKGPAQKIKEQINIETTTPNHKKHRKKSKKK